MKKTLIALAVLVLLLSCASSLAEATLSDALGIIDTDTYTNPYLGLGCTLPGWYFNQGNGMVAEDQFPDEMLADSLTNVLKTAKSITVMTAAADLSGAPCLSIHFSYLSRNMAPIIEKAGLTAILPGDFMDVRKAYESYGAENVDIHLSTVSIGGQDEAAVVIRYTQEGVSYIVIQAILVCDGCLASIASFAPADRAEEAEEVFSLFFRLNEPFQ